MGRVELACADRIHYGHCFIVWPKRSYSLVASFFFSVGLHPLGARWIQEHYLTKGEQETYSYYGVFNKVAFNVGYHNEHHDFPSVPWNKLPQIRKECAGLLQFTFVPYFLDKTFLPLFI
jgi:fatty acid desaturase